MFLSVIFFLLSISSVVILSEFYIIGVLIIIFIFCITLGLLSLKTWHSIKKGSKSAIMNGLSFSLLSSFIFGFPSVIFVSAAWNYPFQLHVSWEILLYVLSFLILIFNITIMVVTLLPSIKAFVDAPGNNK